MGQLSLFMEPVTGICKKTLFKERERARGGRACLPHVPLALCMGALHKHHIIEAAGSAHCERAEHTPG